MTKTINDYTAAISIDAVADNLLLEQSGVYKSINRNTLLGITGSPVGTSDSQTLTNKTITAPTISGPTLSGTVAGTYTLGGTPTFPATVVSTTGVQTLTNKTLTSPAITGGTLDNTTVTVDTIAGHTASTTGTVYGVGITAGVFTTNNILPNNSLSNTGSFGSAWAWTAWTPTVSAATGTFSATSSQSRYQQIGKTVFFRLKITITSFTTPGLVQFTLPVTAFNETFNVFIGNFREDAANGKMGAVRATSTTVANLAMYDNTSSVTTNGELFLISGFYEAA